MRIISPWTIYWISRLDMLQTLAILIQVLSIVALIGVVTMPLLDVDLKPVKVKYGRWLLGAVIISSLLVIFLPDTKTSMEMVLADKITYETVEDAYSKLEESAERIIEVMKED